MSQHRDAPARPLYDLVEVRRIRKGWTKSQLARAAKTDRGTIDKWKTQPRPPLAGTVNAVAEVLGIDPVEALQLAGLLPADEPEPDLAAQNVSWDELLELIADAKAKDDRLIYDALMDVKRKRDARRDRDRPSGNPHGEQRHATG